MSILVIGKGLDEFSDDNHRNVGSLSEPEDLIGHKAWLGDGKHCQPIDGAEEESIKCVSAEIKD